MPAPVIFFDLGDTLVFTGGNNTLQVFADTFDTLQILQQRGYRLGLLSNQPATTTVDQINSLLASLGLARYIERVLITIPSEVPGNVGKPQRPIFDVALQKAGHAAPSAQSIFVTEELAHVQAARGFGWRAVLKRNSGSCQPAEGECVLGLAGLLALLPPLAGLAGTNLYLAPQPKVVDGLWAVPVDITRIAAILSFDGATSSGTGDATIDFRLGRFGGQPIFDLRQTITAAALDGAALPVSRVAHHDFGGGPQAQLRVVEAELEAGSTHTLHVNYSLGTPQASTAGSYQPALVWSSGPRLAFNFGFTDLGAGRYLEAWVPANLIYDQFEIDLELRLLNTTIPHTVITNGQVSNLGANHWRVEFPARFTALSPLLEIRATDTLASASDATTLPVSGSAVTIDMWKLASSATNLPAQINSVKTWLADNEMSTGAYLHGNRFVAFMNVGGMEYEGGTTASTGSLRHETFHSWWARGLKPASQPDAWFDEAWTTYFDNGANESEPFNMADPRVELCSRNPWARVTPGNAYTAGYRFWKGVAAVIGVNTLKRLMSDFYKQRYPRPALTTDIEEFLVCRTGNTQLVDFFHRFVYGFDNPAPAPNLWLRDDPADPGADQWAGRFWDSPDLWVRNADDDGTTHQSPEFGQDNWFYARVRNRGTGVARHFVVTFNVKQFAGTQFAYPADFVPCVAAPSGFELGPGASLIVKARWPRTLVPFTGTHTCLLASVLTRGDQPVAGRHVWEHNNLAQKNLVVVNLLPNQWIVIPVVVSNLRLRLPRQYELELARPVKHLGLEASLIQTSRKIFIRVPPEQLKPFEPAPAIQDSAAEPVLDCGGSPGAAVVDSDADRPALTSDSGELVGRLFPRGVEAVFVPGATARLPVMIGAQDQLLFGLRLRVPPDAQRGETLQLDLIQRDAVSRQIAGGVAVQIRVR